MKSTFSVIYYLKRQVVKKDGTVPVMGRITVDGSQTQFFLGLEHRYHTLMQVFRQHNEDYEKQVDAGMKAKGTLLKYRTVYKHLQEFLTIRYRVKDIALKELTPAFISDFEMFLRTDKHCCTNTVWLYVCPLRTMVFINQEGGNCAQFPDERGNPAADGGQAEKRQAGALPRPLPVLRLHRLVVRRHAQPTCAT